jgi:hypothetical protein
MYIVHMKHVTASAARRNWFTLLDEAVKGQVIAIERNGHKLVLRAEKPRRAKPSSRKLITGRDLDNADKWSWDWNPAGKLVPLHKK